MGSPETQRTLATLGIEGHLKGAPAPMENLCRGFSGGTDMDKLNTPLLDLKGVSGLFHSGDVLAHERRTEVRRPVAAPASVQLLDDSLQSVGAPIMMVVRDISTNGIGLLSPRQIDAKYLTLKLGDDESQPIFRILRCEPVAAIFNIGCRLLKDSEIVRIMLSRQQSTNPDGHLSSPDQ